MSLGDTSIGAEGNSNTCRRVLQLELENLALKDKVERFKASMDDIESKEAVLKKSIDILVNSINDSSVENRLRIRRGVRDTSQLMMKNDDETQEMGMLIRELKSIFSKIHGEEFQALINKGSIFENLAEDIENVEIGSLLTFTKKVVEQLTARACRQMDDHSRTKDIERNNHSSSFGYTSVKLSEKKKDNDLSKVLKLRGEIQEFLNLIDSRVDKRDKMRCEVDEPLVPTKNDVKRSFFLKSLFSESKDFEQIDISKEIQPSMNSSIAFEPNFEKLNEGTRIRHRKSLPTSQKKNREPQGGSDNDSEYMIYRKTCTDDLSHGSAFKRTLDLDKRSMSSIHVFSGNKFHGHEIEEMNRAQGHSNRPDDHSMKNVKETKYHDGPVKNQKSTKAFHCDNNRGSFIVSSKLKDVSLTNNKHDQEKDLLSELRKSRSMEVSHDLNNESFNFFEILDRELRTKSFINNLDNEGKSLKELPGLSAQPSVQRIKALDSEMFKESGLSRTSITNFRQESYTSPTIDVHKFGSKPLLPPKKKTQSKIESQMDQRASRATLNLKLDTSKALKLCLSDENLNRNKGLATSRNFNNEWNTNPIERREPCLTSRLDFKSKIFKTMKDEPKKTIRAKINTNLIPEKSFMKKNIAKSGVTIKPITVASIHETKKVK